MIYTSYFAKNRMLVSKGVVGISIALYTPKYWHGASFKTLAPTPEILEHYKQSHDADQYRAAYNDGVLAKLDPRQVARDVKALVGNKRDIALLCYETPLSFCHRQLVAEWLTANGIPCEEWKEA